MPGLDYAVENFGAQGLSLAATLNQISDTHVGIWNLGSISNDVPVNAEFFPGKNLSNDRSIDSADRRQQVAEADIAPGGKYRSIVKLFLRYANQKASDPWAIATGWLIAPDLIVTAGNSAFDWPCKLGRLTHAKAYIGYNGKASVNNPTSSTQFRQGDQVATPAEWLRSRGIRSYNVAFIKVDQPFTEAIPFDFQDTPPNGTSSLGIVGYAGDIADQNTGEKGAHIYEMFSNISWNLEDSEYSMLEYNIDPYGGNSGSPVLRQDDLVSIGTHVYGGSPSLASGIGLLGNPFEDYVAAFSVEPRRPRKQTDAGIIYVRISTTESMQQQNTYKPEVNDIPKETNFVPALPSGYDETPKTNGHDNPKFSGGTNGSKFPNKGFRVLSSNDPAGNPIDPAPSLSFEEFFEILKKGIRLSDPVLGNILDIHLPLVLGPVGSPVGALAGVILSAAGKLTTQSSSPVYNFRQGLPYDGIVERAILGEAAFSAVMSMQSPDLEKLGIFSSMAKIVKDLAPATKQIAPYIMHILTVPALRIALHELQDKEDVPGAKSGFAISARTPFAKEFTPSGDALDPEAETFIKRLSARLINPNESGELSSGIDRILQIGFREAGPVLTTIGHEGLQHLSSTLPTNASRGNGLPSHHPFIEGLPERGMLGEAALQALMKVPNELDEKAFDKMAQSVTRIGQVVLEITHGLVEDIGFAVKGILSASALGSNESSAEPSNPTRSSKRRQKAMSVFNLEREVLDLYRGLEKKLQPVAEF